MITILFCGWVVMALFFLGMDNYMRGPPESFKGGVERAVFVLFFWPYALGAAVAFFLVTCVEVLEQGCCCECDQDDNSGEEWKCEK